MSKVSRPAYFKPCYSMHLRIRNIQTIRGLPFSISHQG